MHSWLVICHTEITEITDFKQKHFKTAFSLFMCFALLLSVLSSLLVNEFPDSPDNPSNKPMAYEQFKSKKQSLRSKTPCGTLTSYFSPPHRGGAGRGSVVFYLGKVVSRRDADEDGRLR